MAPTEQIPRRLAEWRRLVTQRRISARRKGGNLDRLDIERRDGINTNRNGNNNGRSNRNRNGGDSNNKNRNRNGNSISNGSRNNDGQDGSDDGSNDKFGFNFFDRESSDGPSIAQVTEVPAPTAIATSVSDATSPSIEANPTLSIPVLIETPSSFATKTRLPSLSLFSVLPSSTLPGAVFIASIPTTLAETSTLPQRGLSDESSTTSASISIRRSTITAIAEADSTFSPTAIANAAAPSDFKEPPPPGSMTPLAQRLLITAGAIGGLIVLVAAIYLFLRLRHKDAALLHPRRRPNKSWTGSSRGAEQVFEVPPRYSPERRSLEDTSYSFTEERKAVLPKRELDPFYSVSIVPALATPERVAALLKRESRRPEPVEPVPTEREMYNSMQRRSQAPLRAPGGGANKVLQQTGFLPSASAYNNTGTLDSTRSREISDSYNNTGTQVTFLSRQTTNLDTTSPIQQQQQQQPNRMSLLSSLSSGFGSDMVISENGGIYTKNGATRQSRKSKFSWQTASVPGTPGMRSDRDTISTTNSVESAPRFRSVNSWVDYQSVRVEKREKKMEERMMPKMPAIPAGIRVEHRRQESEISAFNRHPGEEVEFRPGSRVPSEVLDKKLGY